MSWALISQITRGRCQRRVETTRAALLKTFLAADEEGSLCVRLLRLTALALLGLAQGGDTPGSCLAGWWTLGAKDSDRKHPRPMIAGLRKKAHPRSQDWRAMKQISR